MLATHCGPFALNYYPSKTYEIRVFSTTINYFSPQNTPILYSTCTSFENFVYSRTHLPSMLIMERKIDAIIRALFNPFPLSLQKVKVQVFFSRPLWSWRILGSWIVNCALERSFSWEIIVFIKIMASQSKFESKKKKKKVTPTNCTKNYIPVAWINNVSRASSPAVFLLHLRVYILTSGFPVNGRGARVLVAGDRASQVKRKRG